MALHFLVDDAGARPGETVVLTGAEAHHAASVRRVRRNWSMHAFLAIS